MGTAYGSIFLDKSIYTWTDKINIRITEHGVDADGASVKIHTSDYELSNYKLSKAGNGLYTGEVILTGFLHDVNGDGNPDTNPRTVGNGPNNGFLETGSEDKFTITVEFGDGDKISKSAPISWNNGTIVLDKPSYLLNESAIIQVIDVDMNLNPETLDKTSVHVFSDSDKAGIIVDAIETQEESGVFETTVSFTQEYASSGNRLFAMHGDGLSAQYDDYTLPSPFRINDDLEIVAESILFNDYPIPEPEQDITIPENCGPGTILQDGVCVVEEPTPNTTSTGIWGTVIEFPSKISPLKQFKSGVSIDEIQCKENLVLLKKHNDYPACVKPTSVIDLIKRNWLTTEEIDGYAIDYNGDVKHLPFADICTNEMKIILLSHSNLASTDEEFAIEDVVLPFGMNSEDFERCSIETSFTKERWNMVDRDNE